MNSVGSAEKIGSSITPKRAVSSGATDGRMTTTTNTMILHLLLLLLLSKERQTAPTLKHSILQK
jgi:hypothetical protein